MTNKKKEQEGSASPILDITPSEVERPIPPDYSKLFKRTGTEFQKNVHHVIHDWEEIKKWKIEVTSYFDKMVVYLRKFIKNMYDHEYLKSQFLPIWEQSNLRTELVDAELKKIDEILFRFEFHHPSIRKGYELAIRNKSLQLFIEPDDASKIEEITKFLIQGYCIGRWKDFLSGLKNQPIGAVNKIQIEDDEKGTNWNLRKRYQLVKELGWRQFLDGSEYSQKSKEKLISKLFSCDIRTARDLLNNTREFEIKEDEIQTVQTFLTELKKGV